MICSESDASRREDEENAFRTGMASNEVGSVEGKNELKSVEGKQRKESVKSEERRAENGRRGDRRRRGASRIEKKNESGLGDG